MHMQYFYVRIDSKWLHYVEYGQKILRLHSWQKSLYFLVSSTSQLVVKLVIVVGYCRCCLLGIFRSGIKFASLSLQLFLVQFQIPFSCGSPPMVAVFSEKVNSCKYNLLFNMKHPTFC
jgi:hypothetical protein